jgi:hypothetical protein
MPEDTMDIAPTDMTNQKLKAHEISPIVYLDMARYDEGSNPPSSKK